MPYADYVLCTLSLLLLIMTLATWRGMKAVSKREKSVHLRMQELEDLRNSIDGLLREDQVRESEQPHKSLAQDIDPGQHRLVEQIRRFVSVFDAWCDAVGDLRRTNPMSNYRDAMMDLQKGAAIEPMRSGQKFNNIAEDVMKIVLTYTDLDFKEHPNTSQLRDQLQTLVQISGLEVIDPKVGSPLDRNRHQPTGGSSTRGKTGRETISLVDVRGLLRPAGKSLPEKIIRKAEVHVSR